MTKSAKSVVHLIVKRCDATGRDLGFKNEVQPFIGGKPIDDVRLTSEKKKRIAKRFRKTFDVVFVNGKKT